MKRLADCLVSFILLLLLFPLLLLIAFFVFRNLGSPIFFCQVRPGLNGRSFRMFKFRTMLNLVNDRGGVLSDSERLTSFGAFLRSTSLDELPELWNVFKGDMSLVGPRPLLEEYLPLYTQEQYRRHSVRPGVTGWAQVNGRNAISWGKKFELDVWYVDNQTFSLDMKILFMTVRKVFARDGISADGEATMPFFKGDQKSDRE
jgi:lipopolysaccharide/colanic/teichoic acid biosynthesis glycosyltransferase